MKRFLLALAVLAAGIATVVVYSTTAREREYARLIATGDAAVGVDQPLVAIEAFSGAIALRPDSMLAYLKRGETYQHRSDWGSALRDLRTAAGLDPTATRPLERLGDVHYATQRYARAAERYAAYLRLDDQSPRLLYKLALAHYGDGKIAAAIPPLRQAVSQNDRFAEAFYLLGVCLRDQGANTEARAVWERAAQLAPALGAAREELVSLARTEGRVKNEVDQLEVLAGLEPERVEPQINLAVAYARARRIDQAVLTLARAEEKFRDHPQIRVALGRVWLEAAESRGDRVALGKALEALQGSVSGAPPNSEALSLLGRALLLRRDHMLAERILEQATETYPVDASAYRYLADVAQQNGHFVLARDALVSYHALADEPDEAGARAAFANRIAELSLRVDQPAVAATWLRRALAAAPSDIGLVARLAEAHWRAGEPEQARDTLAIAIARDPANPELLALQHRMQNPR